MLCCAVQETDEERGRRIASQWTNDPAAAGSAVRAQGSGQQTVKPAVQPAVQPAIQPAIQPAVQPAVQPVHQTQPHQLATQPQDAQPTPHATAKVANISAATSSHASSRDVSHRGIGRGSSRQGLDRDSMADSAGQELAAGRHTAAAAAGVVVAQRAYVVVWAVLLVGCVAIGGRRLIARTQR